MEVEGRNKTRKKSHKAKLDEVFQYIPYLKQGKWRNADSKKK